MNENEPPLCDYCRNPCSRSVLTLEHGDYTYEFCSNVCREAMQSSDRVYTQYHDFRRFRPGLAGLDPALPQGIPRNSCILLASQMGTRDRAIHAELVWRTLQRNEPAVIISFQEPPIAILEQFIELDWNIIPYIEAGQLQIIDCFTYRLEEQGRFFDRMTDWNQHLQKVARKATLEVEDATDLPTIQSRLDNCLESIDMIEEGIVLLDSLTEIGSLVQPIQAYDFVKDIRAEVSKSRFVPIFAGASYSSQDDFPRDLEYIFDGIIDLQLNDEIVEDTLIKQLRIRKLESVLAISEWQQYEFTSEQGMVVFDPQEEMEKVKTEE